MENPRKKESRIPMQCNMHCPHCSKKWFTATRVVDLNFKCFNCYRRYLINLDESRLSFKFINILKDDELD